MLAESDVRAPVDNAIRICDIDEDATTMAVQAVESLLELAERGSEAPSRIFVSSRWGAASIDDVSLALTGRLERAENIGFGSPVEDVVVPPGAVRVDVEAVHAGDDAFRAAAPAQARARFVPSVGDSRPGRSPASADVSLTRPQLQALSAAEAAAGATLPMGAHVPLGTWDASRPARYRLLMGRCDEGHSWFPATPACRTCGAPATIVSSLGRARVHTLARVAAGGGPTEFDFLQSVWDTYASVLVVPHGVDGVRIPGIGTDAGADVFGVGLEVQPCFRRIYCTEGAWRYGRKFRPAPPRAR